jgi:glycosyltransferase involved in cell wall biosynthesis
MVEAAVLIPCLDCAATIGEVVAGARRFVGTVLVVDDGSNDATAEAAARAGAEVVSHPANLGKGAALRTGMEWLALRGFSHALSMDGDGQHLAEEIPHLLDAWQREPSALIIGARQLADTQIAALNLFGNRFANRWVERACGRAISDTQSGFRVYPIGPTLDLGVRAARFAFETEVLIRAVRAGVPIRSVPVRVYYPPPEQRASHYRRFTDTVRIVLVVVGLMLRLW